MSTIEKKGYALEKIAAIQNEAALDEIIIHLEKLEKENKVYNLSKHFEEVNAKYGEVLKKLAQ
jgi:hypothetical protein